MLLLAVVVGATFAIPTGFIMRQADTARAATDCSGGGLPINTDAKQADGSYHRGVRARDNGIMTPTDFAVVCARVGSIFMQMPTTAEFIETGWGLLDPSYPKICSNDFTGSKPRWVIAYHVLGASGCTWYGQLDSGTWHNYSISDADGNGVFAIHHDATFITDVVANGTSGTPETNGERHYEGSGEGAHVEFANMEYETGSGWFRWSNVKAACTTDGEYHNQFDAAYHVETVSGAPANLGFCDNSPN